MAPSPARSEQHARVIRELARDLRSSPRSLPSPTPSPVERDQNEESYRSPPGSSAFDPTQDALVSTQQLDDNTRPLLRSSARRFGYYQPPPPLPHVDTSVVAKEFGDFDQEAITEDDSVSIEIPRGGKKSTHNTPGTSRPVDELSPSAISKVDYDSLYDVTPPSRSRLSARKSLGGTGSLRRDAQIRRASTIPQSEVDALLESRGKTAAPERRRSTLFQMHSKVVSEEEASFNEERPLTITNTYKSTRFGGQTSQRATSAAPISNQVGSAQNTPQRPSNGTPRSTTVLGNATQQSFMLPDLPNLTELVSGVSQDGTLVFSKTMKPRSRFSSAPNPGRFSSVKPRYPPIESVPIPSDEKALFTSLQLLKEKTVGLEKDKADAERMIQEQAAELVERVNGIQAQGSKAFPRGSTDGAKGQSNWEAEKSKRQATVETPRVRLDRAERKLSVHKITQKHTTSDRGNLYQELNTALITSEELRAENEALQSENKTLRDEVDALRLENAELRHEEGLRTKTSARQHARYQDQAEEFDSELEARRSMKPREIADKAQRREKAQYARLKAENDALRLQLANAETQHGEEQHLWAQKEGELRLQLDAKSDTLRQFTNGAQAEINETLRQDNESLRIKLMELSSRRDYERQQWADKEARLRQKIEKREDILRTQRDHEAATEPKKFAQGLSRRASSKGLNSNDPSTKLNDRRDKNTQTRIADRVDQEIRKSRNAVAAHHQSDYASRSRSKSHSAEPPRANAPGQSPRRASASSGPSPYNIDAPSESESTTDLSIARVRASAVVTVTSQERRTSGDTITQSEAMDMTTLSFMGRDEIAQLRKTLEEERAAARKRASFPARVTADDTVQSSISVKTSQQHPLPRKSSMKNITKAKVCEAEGTANGDDLFNSTIQHRTEESILSNSSRRRRSAPVELTSAFIIPDITVRLPPPSHPVPGVGSHDSKNCTMCNRSIWAASVGALASSKPSAAIPAPVPVSSREDLGPDATVRPSQLPQDALALVLKELEDELAHLKMDLAAQEALLQTHDPALRKRQRKTVQARIHELLKAIDVRFDQIYALYDVLEGQRADGLLDGHDNHENQRKRMSEREIDDTLRSVGLDPQEARKGKRVTINEVDSEEESLPEGSDLDDLPWEGISDVESIRSIPRDGLRGKGALEV